MRVLIEAPRSLGPARLARLAAVHQAAFAPARGWTAEEIGALASHGVFAAADDGSGEEAGFILLSLAADEAEVLTLAVAPERRRSGLGRALLAAGTAEVARAGASKVFLEVAEDNAPALALYAAAGFRETGRRRAYYRRDDRKVDALLLEARCSAGSAER